VKTITQASAFIHTIVDLLYNRRDPNGIRTEFIKVTFVDFLDDAAQVATFKAAQFARFFVATQIDGFRGFAVVESIDEQK
jgi:hypothetical protein